MKRIPAQTLAAVLVCCALWIAFGSLIVGNARRHDFLNLYTGASLALDGEFNRMYDPAMQLARERRFVPDVPALVPFVRPPFYALLLAPLALIPYGLAFWIWIVLQSALLIGCWIWAFRRWGPDAAIFGALYLPTALGVAHGQDCVFMLLILIGAWILAEREKPAWCGALLALGLIKFHLFLLWPVAMLVTRRWRTFAGYVAGVSTVLTACWLLAGNSGLLRYVELLRNRDIERLNPSPELTISVHGLALNLSAPALIPWLIALVLVIFLLAMRDAPLWRWFAATAVASVLAPPHVYGYDAGLVLLAVWLAIFESGYLPVRIAATALSTPLPFLIALAGKPWAATAPLALLAFLIALAANGIKSRPTHTPQTSAR